MHRFNPEVEEVADHDADAGVGLPLRVVDNVDEPALLREAVDGRVGEDPPGDWRPVSGTYRP